MVIAYAILLALVGAERLVELRLSRRNADRALARGGVEAGQRHFFWMKVLHAAFLPACLLEVVALQRPFLPLLGAPMLALVVLAQALRYWAIASLGERWNVRVIVVPGLPAVVAGPYRYLRHPNYVAVVLEGIALPLVHTAWITALAFTLLNAALLAVRIRCEEETLSEHCGYAERFGGRGRFLPDRFPARISRSETPESHGIGRQPVGSTTSPARAEEAASSQRPSRSPGAGRTVSFGGAQDMLRDTRWKNAGPQDERRGSMPVSTDASILTVTAKT